MADKPTEPVRYKRLMCKRAERPRSAGGELRDLASKRAEFAYGMIASVHRNNPGRKGYDKDYQPRHAKGEK